VDLIEQAKSIVCADVTPRLQQRLEVQLGQCATLVFPPRGKTIGLREILLVRPDTLRIAACAAKIPTARAIRRHQSWVCVMPGGFGLSRFTIKVDGAPLRGIASTSSVPVNRRTGNPSGPRTAKADFF
jgi:hypothetical protein